MSEKKITAVLNSDTPPSADQERGFLAFLREKYGAGVDLVWKEDRTLGSGFRLAVGSEVYDWSREGRLTQLKKALASIHGTDENLIPLLAKTVGEWEPRAEAEEIGHVLTVGDGIATVDGLSHVEYGEILLFSSGIRGMAQELRTDEVGCILFGDDSAVEEGSEVRRTGRTAGIPVGEGFLGRVVNALGAPIDGFGEILADGYRPVENPAPSIIDRQPVNRPLETGILAIDSMFPIGRGQRELIIGDRQTGKTAIATDVILNQRGRDVVCIYVAIGQKASSVAKLVENLRVHGAMDYTIVINAGASDSAPMQYIAPYAGCAMGEYFMEKGRDVLIVYDDLSKHAVAYRSISLLLDRAPGREAYPGDVFYLHSRLLERAAHLSAERGGGSMTALPIVETQAGDVSSYIPTNIISITDGQIFLESDLFFAGQRPAVNVGLSVSRVGRDAQTQAMKKATGTLRLDLAQYREMEVFTQFSSELDEGTQRELVYGQGLMRMLRQNQNSPLSQAEQVVILTAALHHLYESTPVNRVKDEITALLDEMRTNHAGLMERIESTGLLSDSDREEILAAAKSTLEVS